jgi:hypothetical protein
MVSGDVGGARRAPKCSALTRANKPCGRMRLAGVFYCGHHLKGRERDVLDAHRLERAQMIAAAGRPIERLRALKMIRNIQRRMLHRTWLNHPEIEGSTLELSTADEQCVRSCLRDELGLNIERLDRVTGRELSARAVDRARWCAYRLLRGTVEPEAARRRVVNLLRDERRFWARQAGHDLPR